MNRAINLTGRVFGRLTAVKHSHTAPSGAMWLCSCSCGTTCMILSSLLRRGNTQSCGCYRRELRGAGNFRHGFAKRGNSHEYHAFLNARRRCIDPTDKRYADYGGRGIKFLLNNVGELMASIGPRSSNDYSLDRIDNDGHYEIGNIRWATRQTQQRNRRNNAH